ncbi:hypothetical protein [Streptomyces sp. NPDC001601]|uniref:hypothetical protein n=1 Tax=Streptomyces sp. NPDC001601 TaxID=3364592 RepID=UPI003692DFB7
MSCADRDALLVLTRCSMGRDVRRSTPAEAAATTTATKASPVSAQQARRQQHPLVHVEFDGTVRAPPYGDEQRGGRGRQDQQQAVNDPRTAVSHG